MNTSTKIRSQLTACLLTAVPFAFGAGAHAAEQPQLLTKVVAYGDLNLDSEQGAKVLYARLRNAARSVCAPFESRELSIKSLLRTCVDDAVASAVVQVNKTTVTALHNQYVNRSAKG